MLQHKKTLIEMYKKENKRIIHGEQEGKCMEVEKGSSDKVLKKKLSGLKVLVQF